MLAYLNRDAGAMPEFQRCERILQMTWAWKPSPKGAHFSSSMTYSGRDRWEARFIGLYPIKIEPIRVKYVASRYSWL